MQTAWLQILDCVLRPERPEMERCLAERERHLAARRLRAEEQARALANCERRIQDARALVLAADDGVVSVAPALASPPDGIRTAMISRIATV